MLYKSMEKASIPATPPGQFTTLQAFNTLKEILSSYAIFNGSACRTNPFEVGRRSEHNARKRRCLSWGQMCKENSLRTYRLQHASH